MGRELLASEPDFAESMTQIESVLMEHGGPRVVSILTSDRAANLLAETRVAQPTLFAYEVALARLWRSWGVEPAAVVGHSVGEIAAAYVAGILTLDDAARLAVRRGELMEEAPAGGAMAQIALPADEVRAVLAEAAIHDVYVAAQNGPRATAIAGSATRLPIALAALAARGAVVKEVPVRYAFHTPSLDGVVGRLADAVSGLVPAAARIPIVSTRSGRLEPGESFDAVYWSRQLRDPVQFDPP